MASVLRSGSAGAAVKGAPARLGRRLRRGGRPTRPVKARILPLTDGILRSNHGRHSQESSVKPMPVDHAA